MKSKAEIMKEARSALEMLKRAQSGGKTTVFHEPLGATDPVDPSFAIGWAQGCLRRALELPDQPTGGE